MTESDVRAAVEIAKKHNLLILSDEIYEPFLYASGTGILPVSGGAEADVADTLKMPRQGQDARATRLPSPAKLYDRTIILRGFPRATP